MSKELDLETPFFPLYGDVIHIVENTVFWRGFDSKYPVLTSRPAYFGTYETASTYGDTLMSFRNTKSLRLLDIRFLKVILVQILQDNRTNEKLDIDDRNTLLYLITSFGLFSLKNQISIINELFKGNLHYVPGLKELEKMYNPKSIIEQPGVRVAITEVDGFTMSFLSELFRHKLIHGFISPRLHTPFHIEKRGTMNPEIIIFDPHNSNIEPYKVLPNTLPKININKVILQYHPLYTVNSGKYTTDFFMIGSGIGKKRIHPLDVFNRMIDDKDKDSNTLYNAAIKSGKRWNMKYSTFSFLEPPVPSVPSSIFEK